jgi:hypothetical protein
VRVHIDSIVTCHDPAFRNMARADSSPHEREQVGAVAIVPPGPTAHLSSSKPAVIPEILTDKAYFVCAPRQSSPLQPPDLDGTFRLAGRSKLQLPGPAESRWP